MCFVGAFGTGLQTPSHGAMSSLRSQWTHTHAARRLFSNAPHRGSNSAGGATTRMTVTGTGAGVKLQPSTSSGGSGGGGAAQRVAALRALLRKNGLAAYIVPSADAHSSEYAAACDERRQYLTGFTGSAGIALVTLEDALCWTDARYYVQAARQLDPAVFTMMRAHEDPPLHEWLANNLPPGSVVGVDSATVSVAAVNRLTKGNQLCIKPLPAGENLVDQIWGADRPAHPSSTVTLHDVVYAGEDVPSKLSRVREEMRQCTPNTGEGGENPTVACHVVAALDEVAWLLNLRGSDVSYNPVFWSYVVVTVDECVLYCDFARLDTGVEDTLAEFGVSVRPYGAIFEDLLSLQLPTGAAVWLDPKICNYGIQQVLASREGDATVHIHHQMGPVQLMKAAKNDTELAGMRAAHLRDGVALVSFLAWLEDEVVHRGNEPTECEAADVVDGLRAAQDNFVSLSFPTISSADANGAVIHYKPEVDTCAKITRDSMYLVDSGAQYRDGTTDVTRTVHLGTPTAWQRECYTRVLRGHIALQMAKFPKGTTGIALDALARAPLWQGGIDYKHGTGHGVGSFLNVHEGPHSIANRPAAMGTALQPGFVTSNEPGYYEETRFGIRLENLCVVRNTGLDTPYSQEMEFYALENLTLAPFQAKLIDRDMLSKPELQWLNEYHAHVLEMLAPRLQPSALEWLRANTRPL